MATGNHLRSDAAQLDLQAAEKDSICAQIAQENECTIGHAETFLLIGQKPARPALKRGRRTAKYKQACSGKEGQSQGES